MTLRDFVNKLLGRQPASATTARERLQLVLAHDRSDLTPELLEQMRRSVLHPILCNGRNLLGLLVRANQKLLVCIYKIPCKGQDSHQHHRKKTERAADIRQHLVN